MAALIPSASASGSGTMTLASPATNSNQTITIPDATGTMMVSGNMPAFSAYQSSAQTLSSNTATKLTFTTEEFDTNNNFASSTFTPNVAGYYQISCGFEVSTAACGMLLYVYKNGSNYKKLTNTNPIGTSGLNGSALVYCNGSSDYVEIYGLVATGQASVASSVSTYFQGVMVRNA